MADLTGNTGSVTIGAAGLKMAVTGWSGTLQINEAEIPAAFGEKWVGGVLTTGRFRGSLRGKVQYNASSTKPIDMSGADWSALSGSATLTAATGCTVAGTLNYSNISIEHNRDGSTSISADFSNAGTDMAVTWDEAP